MAARTPLVLGDDGLPQRLQSTDSLGGSIGAVGADGAIQFATGGVLDSHATKFVWDRTNQRLGIGVAAPSWNVDTRGSVYVDYLGIGTNPVAAQALAISKSQSLVGGESIYGATITGGGRLLTSDVVANILGVSCTGSISGSFNLTGSSTLYGGGFSATINLNAGKSIPSAVGGGFTGYLTTAASVGSLKAGEFLIQNLNAGGTITKAYGVYVGPGFNNGVIGTMYGMYIEALLTATKVWAFYSNSAAASFMKGSLYIGNGGAVSDPTTPLDVNGAIRTRPVTVGTLPLASAAGEGSRHHVTDSTLAYASANIGTAVTGGGANKTPVKVVNGSWVIG